jgi:hypothetical protein
LPRKVLSHQTHRGRTISQVVSEWKKSDSPAAIAFVQSTPTIDNNLRKRLLR